MAKDYFEAAKAVAESGKLSSYSPKTQAKTTAPAQTATNKNSNKSGNKNNKNTGKKKKKEEENEPDYFSQAYNVVKNDSRMSTSGQTYIDELNAAAGKTTAHVTTTNPYAAALDAVINSTDKALTATDTKPAEGASATPANTQTTVDGKPAEATPAALPNKETTIDGKPAEGAETTAPRQEGYLPISTESAAQEPTTERPTLDNGKKPFYQTVLDALVTQDHAYDDPFEGMEPEQKDSFKNSQEYKDAQKKYHDEMGVFGLIRDKVLDENAGWKFAEKEAREKYNERRTGEITAQVNEELTAEANAQYDTWLAENNVTEEGLKAQAEATFDEEIKQFGLTNITAEEYQKLKSDYVQEYTKATMKAYEDQRGTVVQEMLNNNGDYVTMRVAEELKETDWGRLMYDIIGQGAGQTVSGVTNTLDMLLGWAAQPFHQVMRSTLSGVVDIGEKNYISRVNDWVNEQYSIIQEAAYNNAYGNKTAELINKYGATVTGAIPMAVMAVMTAGMSAAGTATTKGLQAYSYMMSQGTGLAQWAATISTGLITMMKDPNFSMSMVTETGSAYKEALDNGAKPIQAAVYATTYGWWAALVEVGGVSENGGLQSLPRHFTELMEKEAANLTPKQAAMKGAWEYAKSIISEPGEEVVQGLMEVGLSCMYGNDVDVIKKDKDTDALIDPARMGEEAAGAAITSAILGGGQILSVKAVNSVAKAAMKKQADMSKIYVQDESGNVTDLKTYLEQHPEAKKTAQQETTDAQIPQTLEEAQALMADTEAEPSIPQTLAEAQQQMSAQNSTEELALPTAEKIDSTAAQADNNAAPAVNTHGTVHEDIAVQSKAELADALSKIDTEHNVTFGDYTWTVRKTGDQYAVVRSNTQDSLKTVGSGYYDTLEQAINTITSDKWLTPELQTSLPQGNVNYTNKDYNLLKGIASGAVKEFGGMTKEGALAELDRRAKEGDVNGRNDNAAATTAGTADSRSTAANAAAEPDSRINDGAAAAAADAEYARATAGRAAETKQTAEPADLHDGGRGRGDGSSQGGYDGRMGGQQKQRTQRTSSGQIGGRQAAVRVTRQNTVSRAGVRYQSAAELGVKYGSEDKTTRVIPENLWDIELKECAKKVYELTGKRCVFILGGINLRTESGATGTARGVFSAEQIIVQADHMRMTATEIADHESMHAMIVDNPGTLNKLIEVVRDNISEAQLQKMLEVYKERYAFAVEKLSPEEATDYVLEEIICDAYAGINAYGANAAALQDAVLQTLEDRKVIPPSQRQGETKATRGPPEQRLSAADNTNLTQKYTTYIDTNPETHTAAEMAKINEYLNAVNGEMKNFVQKVKSLQNKKYRNRIRYEITTATPWLVNKINELTGVDTTGFKVIITGGAIDHIEKRHGSYGKADKSMADINDVARAGYVINNAEGGRLLTNKDGSPSVSDIWKNSDGTPARRVLIWKDIDGTYYAAIATPDNASKTIAVESLFIGNEKNKESTVTVLNLAPIGTQQVTSETPQRAYAFKEIISEAEALDKVNSETVNQNQKFSIAELDEDYMTAAESGDIETAQMLTNIAAEEAGYTIHAYHGTSRGDRVGNVFLPERSTSGPMAFFTSDRSIAENYARDKADTSLKYDEEYSDYHTQFRVNRNGKSISVSDLWKTLTYAQRSKITEAAKHITFDDDGENIIYDRNARAGLGNMDAYTLREHGGNALDAMVESWLDDGNLYGEEERFLDVLKLAGIEDAEYRDPEARHERVYDTFLKISKPFDAAAEVSEDFVNDYLDWYSRQDIEKYEKLRLDNRAADMWDKRNVTAEMFAETMRRDIANGTSGAWTSIPDSMTDYLKSLGYDGIKDVGGKQGGSVHTVWIPFTGEQVKEAASITRDDSGNIIPLSKRFNQQKNDIRFSMDEPVEETDRMIATHAVEPFKLRAAFKAGGIPAPSMAVTRAGKMTATEFGSMTLMFKRKTIDPQADSRNKLYGADAWTPTRDEAKIEYHINSNADAAFTNNIRQLLDTYPDGMFDYPGRIEYQVDKGNGITTNDLDELAYELQRKTPYAAAFLADKGIKIEPQYEKNVISPTKDMMPAIREAVGIDQLKQMQEIINERGWLDEEERTPLFEALRNYYLQKAENSIGDFAKAKYKKRADNIEFLYSTDDLVNQLVKDVLSFTENKIDKYATAAEVDDVVLPLYSEFHEWMKEKLGGVLDGSGIRNDVKTFDENDERREFDELHDPATPENIVKAMIKAGHRGVNAYALRATGLQSVTSAEYNDIEQMRGDLDRQNRLKQGEYDDIIEDTRDIINDWSRKVKSNGIKTNGVLEDAMLEAGRAYDIYSSDEENIRNISDTFKEFGINLTNELAEDYVSICHLAATLPTDYFEAKPERVVGFDEVAAAIIPDDTEQDIIDSLRQYGVRTLFYKAGDKTDRIAKMNSVDDVRFSMDEEASENENNAANSGNVVVGYEVQTRDIARLPDGSMAVRIYTGISALQRIPAGKRAKTIAQMIRTELSGKAIIAENGDVIRITDRSAGEVAYGTNEQELYDKARDTGDYKELNRKWFTAEHAAAIIALSEPESWSENTEDLTDMFKRDGMQKRGVNMVIDNIPFHATVITAINDNPTQINDYGEKFYDIIEIKSQTLPSANYGTTVRTAAVPYKIKYADVSSDMLSVAQKERIVNRRKHGLTYEGKDGNASETMPQNDFQGTLAGIQFDENGNMIPQRFSMDEDLTMSDEELVDRIEYYTQRAANEGYEAPSREEIESWVYDKRQGGGNTNNYGFNYGGNALEAIKELQQLRAEYDPTEDMYSGQTWDEINRMIYSLMAKLDPGKQAAIAGGYMSEGSDPEFVEWLQENGLRAEHNKAPQYYSKSMEYFDGEKYRENHMTGEYVSEDEYLRNTYDDGIARYSADEDNLQLPQEKTERISLMSRQKAAEAADQKAQRLKNDLEKWRAERQKAKNRFYTKTSLDKLSKGILESVPFVPNSGKETPLSRAELADLLEEYAEWERQQQSKGPEVYAYAAQEERERAERIADFILDNTWSKTENETGDFIREQLRNVTLQIPEENWHDLGATAVDIRSNYPGLRLSKTKGTPIDQWYHDNIEGHYGFGEMSSPTDILDAIMEAKNNGEKTSEYWDGNTQYRSEMRENLTDKIVGDTIELAAARIEEVKNQKPKKKTETELAAQLKEAEQENLKLQAIIDANEQALQSAKELSNAQQNEIDGAREKYGGLLEEEAAKRMAAEKRIKEAEKNGGRLKKQKDGNLQLPNADEKTAGWGAATDLFKRMVNRYMGRVQVNGANIGEADKIKQMLHDEGMPMHSRVQFNLQYNKVEDKYDLYVNDMMYGDNIPIMDYIDMRAAKENAEYDAQVAAKLQANANKPATAASVPVSQRSIEEERPARPRSQEEAWYEALKETQDPEYAKQKSEPAGLQLPNAEAENETETESGPDLNEPTRTRNAFIGTSPLQKLGVKIAGSVGRYSRIDLMMAADKAAKSVRKEARKAERRLKATNAEKNFAVGIAAMVYSVEDIPSTMRRAVVEELSEYYAAEKSVDADVIHRQRRDIKDTLDTMMEKIFGGLEVVKKPSAFSMNANTPARNMRKMYGNQKGQEIYDAIFAPVAENEAERFRFVNRMFDEVRVFKDENGVERELNKEERKFVQLMIEGRATEQMVAASEMSEAIKNAVHKAREDGTDIDSVIKNIGAKAKEAELTRKYAEWLDVQDEIYMADSVIVQNAADKYTKMFDQFYDAINDFLVAHGYDPIGFIKGYAPHIQPDDNMNALDKALQKLGLGTSVTELPTEIAGLTATYKPMKKWNPFFLERHGDKAKLDIVEGYESYVDYLSNVLYHTDDIMRVRAMSNWFRRTFSRDNISEEISHAMGLRKLKPEDKITALRLAGELSDTAVVSEEQADAMIEDYIEKMLAKIEKTTENNEMVVWADNYANILAGKQSIADRGTEMTFGRKALNFANKLTSWFAGAQVGAKISSALNQGAQLPMIYAELGAKNFARAAKDAAFGHMRRGAWAEGSDFLTGKNGIDYIVTDTKDMIMEKLFWPAEFMDGMVSTIAVRGAYLKAIEAGDDHDAAMAKADKFGEEVMGSRMRGSKPTLFEAKNPVIRMMTVFQVEALNTWEHIKKDLPRDFQDIERQYGKKKAVKALAGVIVKALIASFALNRLDDELYGGSPAPYDIIGLTANFIASGNGLTTSQLLQSLINDGMEALGMDAAFDVDDSTLSDGEFDLKSAVEDTSYSVLNDIPLLRNMMNLAGLGDGSLPMAGVDQAPNIIDAGKNLLDGVDDGEVLELITTLKDAGLEFVPGGSQLNKTIKGAKVIADRGKRDSKGNLQYTYDDNLLKMAQLLAFGPSATQESAEYYANGTKALTKGQTAAYDAITAFGYGTKETYELIQNVIDRSNELKEETGAKSITQDIVEQAIEEAGIEDREDTAAYLVKAALWQGMNLNWKDTSNPYLSATGWRMKNAMENGRSVYDEFKVKEDWKPMYQKLLDLAKGE